MPTKRTRKTRKIRRAVPLTPGQEHYLATGEHLDFSAFKICSSYNLEANRKEFAAIRADYKPGAFPWAERTFGRPSED